MVTFTKETFYTVNATTPTQILLLDPRRISYEINLSILKGDSFYIAIVGSNFDDVQNNVAPTFTNTGGPPLLIRRNFLEDLDSVTLPVWAVGQSGTNSFYASTREVFLTPVAIDQFPLG